MTAKVCSLLAWAAATASWGTPSETAVLRDEVRGKGWIAYAAATGRGDMDLFVCRPDGSGARNLTNTPDAKEGLPRFSPDGRWLAVDSMEQWAYALWEVASGQPGPVLTGFETAAPVYAADFSASGNKLIWHARGTIQVMDIASGTLGPVMGHEDFISAFALSPDDATLATAAGGTLNGEFTALINFWNPESGERVAAYPLARSASAMAYSPDGAVLAVAVGGDVLLLDPATGHSLQTFHAAGDAVTSLGFSPDGSRLATTGSDGTLRVWSLY